jgi:4-hydroxybenzoate polyprenyltransferase
MWGEVMTSGPETSASGRPWTRWPLFRLLSSVRWDEVLILQGAPLIGAIVSIGNLTIEKVLTLSIFAIGSCLLVAHVVALNDWSGITGDLRDPNRAAHVFTNRGIDRVETGLLSIVLLLLSLLLLASLNWDTLAVAAMIVGLSALYSVPALHLKGVPVLGSLLHLVGGTLHFLLGYSLFHAIDPRGTAIGCYFGLVFAAGHLTHEARDYEGDVRNGHRTNAVAFGAAPAFVAGLVLFAIANVLMVVLAFGGAVPRVLALGAAPFLLQLYWSLRAMRAGLTFASVRQLQKRYRILYAGIGLAMVATIMLAA